MRPSKQARDPTHAAAAQGQRLVARALPQADESLYGWMLRLAEANGYASAKAVLSLAQRGASPPLINFILNRFAQLVDGSFSDFARYDTANGKWSSQGGELGLGPQYFDPRPKVCPACLTDRSVLKSVWNLKIWRFCPQHFCKLIQSCPFCVKPLVRGQRAVTHCGNKSCAEDLSRCVSDPIPKDTLKMVGLLGDVASGRISVTFPDLPESFKEISLGDLVRLITFLSTPLLHGKNDLSQECSACESLKITEDTLTAWPRGYYQYLHQLACLHLHTSEGPPVGSWLLKREFPFLLTNLMHGKSGISDSILDILKEELANYIEDHVPHAMDARFTLTGKPSRWATLRRATRELGLSKYKVKQAQRENLIQITSSSVSAKRKYFVERDQMLAHTKHSDTFTPTRVFTAKYSLLSFANSEAFLHVGSSVIRSLVQAGYVETLMHRGTTWCKVSSMNNLLGKLAKIATHPPVYDSSTIELCFCCQSVSASNVLDVIERALIGKFRLIDKGGDHRGLRRFLVYRDDLVRQFPLVPDGYVSVPDASRYPFWTKSYVRKAIRSGHLPSVPHPKKGRMLQVTAVATFRAEYINSTELEDIYGITRNRFWPELIDSAAVATRAPRIKLLDRKAALEILDRKFRRIEKSAIETDSAAKMSRPESR
jgi:hypothetical protein